MISRSLVWQRGSIARIPIATSEQPVHEVRAMWVVRDNIETPEKIRNVVATAKAYGFNTLFVQVRGRGDAWYKLTLEPRAEELANQPLSFDPLQTVIDQAHAAKIQVHAWVNTCYVWSAPEKPLDPSHIVNAHSDWLSCDSDGNTRQTYSENCEGAFLSPSNPDVRQHLHDVFLEITKNYDIDGIHFDYIRYPNRNYDYSPATEKAFAESIEPTLTPERKAELDSGGPVEYVRAFPAEWADWRREQVTSLVEWISKDVKAVKPYVQVSAAVFADWNDAYNERGQDWKRWLKDGALDAVIPMAYSTSTLTVAEQIKDAEQTASEYGRVCYAGVGSWHISADSTMEKIEAAREVGAQGIVLFSYGGVTADGSDDSYLAKLDMFSFRAPALLPKLTSVPDRPSAQQAATPAATSTPSNQPPIQPAS